MSDMPWVRFFPSDWLGGTRGMSASETGIYITLVATMYERGEPVPEDHSRLARLCGASNSAFKTALETLVSEGKIRRTGTGLWNDRVEKESVYRSEKSEVGSRAANMRWHGKTKENNGGDNANALPMHSEGNANQKPDTREEIEPNGSLSETSSDAKPKRSKSRREYPDPFETVWREYPTDANMSKAEAFDAWKKLDAADKDALAASTGPFKAYCRANPDYRPIHMCRFIQKRRFDGFQPSTPQQADDGSVWTKRLSMGRRQGVWSSTEWGPPPGNDGCRVPKQLLLEDDGKGWVEWVKAA